MPEGFFWIVLVGLPIWIYCGYYYGDVVETQSRPVWYSNHSHHLTEESPTAFFPGIAEKGLRV